MWWARRCQASYPVTVTGLVCIENGILDVLIRIALVRRFYWEYTTYHHVNENRKYIPIMLPDLALRLALISSNYPCLKHIFMVPKVFEPLQFYCIINYRRCFCWEIRQNNLDKSNRHAFQWQHLHHIKNILYLIICHFFGSYHIFINIPPS